jgi:hypothetical protein
MPPESGIAEVPAGEPLPASTFFQEFVAHGRALLVRARTGHWNAIATWSPAFLAAIAGELEVPVKTGDIALGRTERLRLGDYVERLQAYDAALARGDATPGTFPYLHDIPLFHLVPRLAADVSPFPTEYFPRWYHAGILRYAQFFMSATGSRTPLHFDTLCTNNLFFQVHGRKRFILISASQKRHCYMRGWRWSAVNASQPDYHAHPQFRHVTPTVVDIEPGDMLFIPSCTLHEVITLSPSISFNVDWHTPATALRGVLSGLRGAPLQNVFYNLLIASGVCLRVPADWLFPYYRSYLSYIS